MDNKDLTIIVSNLMKSDVEILQEIKQLKDRIEKLENAGAQANEGVTDNLNHDAEIARLDVSNKLSIFAQKAAQESIGPLKPDELLMLFMSNDFGKKKKVAVAVVKKFPNNMDEVKNQFSSVLEDLETQVALRKKENELDIKLFQRIRKFNDTLESEKEKIKKVGKKEKSDSAKDQSENVTTRNKKITLEAESAGKSHPGKRGRPKNQAEKTGKKRKLRNSDNEEEDSYSKHLKVNSAASSQERKDQSIAQQSGPYRQRRALRDYASSEEDSQESIKSTGESSKQPDSDEHEETVEEKQISLRGKQIRRD